MVRLNNDFLFSITLESGAETVIDFSDDDTVDDNNLKTSKYAPLRNVILLNPNDSQTIALYKNNNRSPQIVFSGVIKSIEDDRVSSIKLKNLGSVSATFYISANNDETQLSLLKSLVGK